VILYDSKVAPNPRRVRIFLAEKGIELPTRQLDIGKAESREPDFLAKNPLGDIRIAPAQKNLARWHESVSPRPSAKA
jgi:hypothetical protein